MLKLSIIIVNFNTRNYILGCLRSLAKHAPEFPYEIIVVDNGSTDNSTVDIRNFGHKTNNLRLIQNQSNLGFARAVNQGIKQAGGEYLLLLNSDTEVKAGMINRLIDFAQKTNNLGAVGPKLLNPDGSVQGSVFRLPTLIRTIQQYWLGKRGLLDKYVPESKQPIRVEALSMAVFLITPECLKKAGLLNEKYFMYFEDLDYCRKINRVGLAIYYLPEATAIHHHGVSGTKMAAPEKQWQRLIPSSKIYHGVINYYLNTCVIRSAQLWSKLFKKS